MVNVVKGIDDVGISGCNLIGPLGMRGLALRRPYLFIQGTSLLGDIASPLDIGGSSIRGLLDDPTSSCPLAWFSSSTSTFRSTLTIKTTYMFEVLRLRLLYRSPSFNASMKMVIVDLSSIPSTNTYSTHQRARKLVRVSVIFYFIEAR